MVVLLLPVSLYSVAFAGISHQSAPAHACAHTRRSQGKGTHAPQVLRKPIYAQRLHMRVTAAWEHGARPTGAHRR
jgi:hypothetical protein